MMLHSSVCDWTSSASIIVRGRGFDISRCNACLRLSLSDSVSRTVIIIIITNSFTSTFHSLDACFVPSEDRKSESLREVCWALYSGFLWRLWSSSRCVTTAACGYSVCCCWASALGNGWSWSCAPDRTGLWASADPDSPARRSTEPGPRSHLRQVSVEVSAARLSISSKNRHDWIWYVQCWDGYRLQPCWKKTKQYKPLQKFEWFPLQIP